MNEAWLDQQALAHARRLFVNAVRDLHKRGWTQRELAERYGLSIYRVRQILTEAE